MAKTYRPTKPALLKRAILLEFEPNRLAQAALEQAYAELVPIPHRSVRLSRVVPHSKAKETLVNQVTDQLDPAQPQGIGLTSATETPRPRKEAI